MNKLMNKLANKLEKNIMKTKHTPAPWKFHGDGTENLRDDGKTPARSFHIWAGNLITGENLQNIADVNVPIHKSWKHEETQANARLIAAAPELLDALENLVVAGWRADDSDIELTENQRNIAMTDLWKSLRNAEKIISKAKGL